MFKQESNVFKQENTGVSSRYSRTTTNSQMRTSGNSPLPGFKGDFDFKITNIIYSNLAPNTPHPDRCHVRWGKPRRKNVYNGLRSNDHHILQFSATQAPEEELLANLSRDAGKNRNFYYLSDYYF